MTRAITVLLGCVALAATLALGTSCGRTDVLVGCSAAECSAGCRTAGFRDGVCSETGCECVGTGGADADADADARDDGAPDVPPDGTDVAPDVPPDVPPDGTDVPPPDGADVPPPDMVVEDARPEDVRPEDVPPFDGRPDVRPDGGPPFPLCNTGGPCDPTTCSQCCYDNYGSGSGTCAPMGCMCGGGPPDGGPPPRDGGPPDGGPPPADGGGSDGGPMPGDGGGTPDYGLPDFSRPDTGGGTG